MEDDDSRNPSPSSPNFWLHHHQQHAPALRPGRTWSGASNSSTTSSTGGYTASSPLRPWVLILVLAVVILFVLPRPLSSVPSGRAGSASGGFQYASRPASSVFKTGWGAVNAALVMFAIVCGLLGRAGGDNQEAQQQQQRHLDAAGRSLLEGNSLPSTPQHLRVPPSPPTVWYGYPAAQPVRGYAVPGPAAAAQRVEIGVPVPGMRLRRNSSSYPDLRQENWVQANEWRFTDDLGIQGERSNHGSARGGGGAMRWQDSRDGFHFPRPQTPGEHHSSPPHHAPAAAAAGVDYRSPPHGSAPYDAGGTPDVTLRHPRPPSPQPAPTPPAPPPPPPSVPRDTPASKPILVDRVRPRSPPPPPPTPPAGPSPPRHKTRRRRKPSRETFVDPDPEPVPAPPFPLVAPPSPAPPPPPPPPRLRVQDGYEERAHKRRSSGAKDIATAIALFYQNRKKRSGGKGKRESLHEDPEPRLSPEHYDHFDATAPAVPTSTPVPPPPAPPPPPNPSSIFQLFPNKRSSAKSKRVHSVPTSAAPPPPPPPPPAAPAPDPTTPTHTRRTRRPPIPLRRPDDAKAIKITYRRSDYTYGEKLFMPPPPPPPLPESPTTTPKSSAGGPAADEDQDEQSGSARSTSETPSAFCPSPDVNSKADLFIARLRDGWRLEKLKSIQEKEQKRDNLQDRAGADADVGVGDPRQRPS